jgi:ribosomal protein S18 acetylase RimI-like enzyme
VTDVRVTVHETLPPAEAALIDGGLDAFNAAAAPLHEVRPLACAARLADGRVVGGAIGRTWGRCAELQQLWVDPARRGQGWGRRLVRDFEAAAVQRGCSVVFLDTFSFQAPGLYRALGYEERHAEQAYPHGIVKYHMVRVLDRVDGAAGGG